MAGQDLNTKQIITFSQAIQKNNKVLIDNSKAMKSLDNGLKSIKDSLKTTVLGLKTSTAAFLGFGLSIKGLHSTAFDLGTRIIGWHNQLNYLSDSLGSTSAAVGMMGRAWGKSLGDIGEVMAAMGALATQGMRVGAEMENLTVFITNISRASGLSADSLAKMTGAMFSYWNVSVTGSKKMVSAVLAAGKAFGATRDQMQDMIGVVTESVERIGPLFMDGEKSAMALTRGIAMTSGALTKLGVTAKTANEFLSRMLDPERFAETNTLMRMLGVTFDEQMRMYEGAAGKELFFDKLLQNLPRLSQQIQSIQNPLARLQYAKSLGLPPEIAAKLARASASQMRGIIEEYRAQAEGEEAAAEKQRLAAANQARFQESLDFFKMKVLMPFIQWAMGPGFALAMRIRNMLAPVITFFIKGIVKIATLMDQTITPIISAINTGNWGNTLVEAFESFIAKARSGFDELWSLHIKPFFKNSLLPFLFNTLLPFLGHVLRRIWGEIYEFSKTNLGLVFKVVGGYILATKGLWIAGFVMQLTKIIGITAAWRGLFNSISAGIARIQLQAQRLGTGNIARGREIGPATFSGRGTPAERAARARQIRAARGGAPRAGGGRFGAIVGTGLSLAAAGGMLYSSFGGGADEDTSTEAESNREAALAAGAGPGRGTEIAGRVAGAAGIGATALTAGQMAAGTRIGQRAAAAAAARVGARASLVAAKGIPLVGWALTAAMAVYDGVQGYNAVQQNIGVAGERARRLSERELADQRQLLADQRIRNLNAEEQARLVQYNARLTGTTGEKISGVFVGIANMFGQWSDEEVARKAEAMARAFGGGADLTQSERGRELATRFSTGGVTPEGRRRPTVASDEDVAAYAEHERINVQRNMAWGQDAIRTLNMQWIEQIRQTEGSAGQARMQEMARWNQLIVERETQLEEMNADERHKQIVRQNNMLLSAHMRGDINLTEERINQLRASNAVILGRYNINIADTERAAVRLANAGTRGFMGAVADTMRATTTVASWAAALDPSKRSTITMQQAAISRLNVSTAAPHLANLEAIAASIRTSTASDAEKEMRMNLVDAQRRLIQLAIENNRATSYGAGAAARTADNTEPRRASTGTDFLTAFIGAGGLMGMGRGANI